MSAVTSQQSPPSSQMETELGSPDPLVQLSEEAERENEGDGEDGEDESSETREEECQENHTHTETEIAFSNEEKEEDEEDEAKSLFSNRIEELEICPVLRGEETGEGDQVDCTASVPITDPPEEEKVQPVSAWWCRRLFLTLILSAWLCLMLYCYLYLSTTCTQVRLWCPEPTTSFTTRACCSSLWLSLGSPVGLGNECNIDMADMETKCPMYDCYKNKTDGSLNVNGCSWVPNTLFNQEACNIHDLWKVVNLIPDYSKYFFKKVFTKKFFLSLDIL